MGWGTGNGGGGGDGKHAVKKDPGTSAPSSDTSQPKQPPKHGKQSAILDDAHRSG